MTSYVGYLKALYKYENVNFLSGKLVDTSIFEKIAKVDKENETMLFATRVVYRYYTFFAEKGYSKLPEKTLSSMDEIYTSILSAKGFSIEMPLSEKDTPNRVSHFKNEMLIYLSGDYLFRLCTILDLCQLVKIDDKIMYLCYGYYEFKIEDTLFYAIYFLYEKQDSMIVLSIKIQKVFDTFIEHLYVRFCDMYETEFHEIEEFLDTGVIIEKSKFDYKKDFIERDKKQFETIISEHFLDEDNVLKR